MNTVINFCLETRLGGHVSIILDGILPKNITNQETQSVIDEVNSGTYRAHQSEPKLQIQL